MYKKNTILYSVRCLLTDTTKGITTTKTYHVYLGHTETKSWTQINQLLKSNIYTTRTFYNKRTNKLYSVYQSDGYILITASLRFKYDPILLPCNTPRTLNKSIQIIQNSEHLKEGAPISHLKNM